MNPIRCWGCGILLGLLAGCGGAPAKTTASATDSLPVDSLPSGGNTKANLVLGCSLLPN
jgi:hypothetical protein